jgi:hypothetical protein
VHEDVSTSGARHVDDGAPSDEDGLGHLRR